MLLVDFTNIECEAGNCQEHGAYEYDVDETYLMLCRLHYIERMKRAIARKRAEIERLRQELGTVEEVKN